MTKVGPFTVDNDREFTLGDLRKIGPWPNDEGQLVFVDYDGTHKVWFEGLLTETVFDKDQDRYVSVPTREDASFFYDRTKTRRSVLKAMVTRRDNKRRTSDLK